MCVCVCVWTYLWCVSAAQIGDCLVIHLVNIHTPFLNHNVYIMSNESGRGTHSRWGESTKFKVACHLAVIPIGCYALLCDSYRLLCIVM